MTSEGIEPGPFGYRPGGVTTWDALTPPNLHLRLIMHLIIMHLSATLACTSGSCTSVPLLPAPQAPLIMHLDAIMTLYDLLPSLSSYETLLQVLPRHEAPRYKDTTSI